MGFAVSAEIDAPSPQSPPASPSPLPRTSVSRASNAGFSGGGGNGPHRRSHRHSSHTTGESGSEVSELHRVMQLAMEDLAVYGRSRSPSRSGQASSRSGSHRTSRHVERLVLLSLAARITTMVQRLEETNATQTTAPPLDIIRDLPRHALTPRLVRALMSSAHNPDTSNCTICYRTFREMHSPPSTPPGENAETEDSPLGALFAADAASASAASRDVPDAILFPCHHVFCATCAEQWLAKSDLCPNCRQSVVEAPDRMRTACASTTTECRSDATGALAQRSSAMGESCRDMPEWWLRATADDDDDDMEEDEEENGEAGEVEWLSNESEGTSRVGGDVEAEEGRDRRSSRFEGSFQRSCGSFSSAARFPYAAERETESSFSAGPRVGERHGSVLSRTLKLSEVTESPLSQLRLSDVPRGRATATVEEANCSANAEDTYGISAPLSPQDRTAERRTSEW